MSAAAKPTSEPRRQLQVRLPVSLHDQLVHQAAEQGVSLNLLLTALLAGAVNFTLGLDDSEVRALAIARGAVEVSP